jgi:hypothetical protein
MVSLPRPKVKQWHPKTQAKGVHTKRRDDLVADLDGLDTLSGLNDDACELMAHDEAGR